MEDDEEEIPEVVVVPLEDSLDLHTFSPRDVADVVAEYLTAVAGKFKEVRIIHGKGVGTQRRIVHSVLEKHPQVESFQLGGEGRGQWGATVVRLKASG
jgi:dsDNA-specific endonuclease/ATPase MutS2